MHRGGLDACHGLPIPNRPLKTKPEIHPEISEMIDGQPGKCGIMSNVWTGRLILIALSRIFSINDVLLGTVYRIIRSLGKTYRKPGRPRDRQTLSDEVKAGFKEDLATKIVRYVSSGSACSGWTSPTSQPRPSAG